MYPNVHSSTIYNSQDAEATQISINRWTDEEDVEHIHNGILLSHKKGTTICHLQKAWMDLEGIMPSKISLIKTNIVWYHLHVESKKYNKLMNLTKKKQTHKYREQTSGYQRGERRGKGQYKAKGLRSTNYYV